MHSRYHCYCWHCRARHGRNLIATIVLLLALVLLLVHSRVQHHAAPSPAPATRATPPVSPQPPARTSASATAVAGQDLNWVSFHGMQLPVSASAGPRDTRGGLASGFADTPRGALLAAINIGVRTAAQWGTAIFEPTITRQVTGPDAAALLQAEETAYAQLGAAAEVSPGQPAGQGYAAEVGYRFLAWSPASAAVDVVTAGPTAGGTTVLASTRIQVVWLRGDWRVEAPPDGNWASAATAISSLTGYTAFPGER